eukprot:TRINITY_DN14414_c0_g1_i1.p1 TRINITY_DN14414_c0_g1~~TRINITY_DN14414_c0_g1_i1.p1  ORF type:complete len:142 (-),score=52.30 TRINITY_DN14414_c0_g1_i1:83-469(-)
MDAVVLAGGPVDDGGFRELTFTRTLGAAKARVVAAEAAVGACGPSLAEFQAATAALEVAVSALETVAACARRCGVLQGKWGGSPHQSGPALEKAGAGLPVLFFCFLCAFGRFPGFLCLCLCFLNVFFG